MSGFNSAACVLLMINNNNLFSPVAKPTKVGGLDGGRARRFVNSKGIMEETPGPGLKKGKVECQRTGADRSRSLEVRGHLGGPSDARSW